jgi:GH24 family phage-related lysozyme (muramidase)
MADFVTPNAVPQVRAPQPVVSPGQIAQPYQELAANLDKAGEALSKDVAEPLAHQAGLRAVQTDAAGNITVDRPPVVGDAAVAWSRAVKIGAVAEGEGEARRHDIALRQQFRDNPEGYRVAAEQFRQELIKKYTDAAGPEVGVTMGRLLDNTATQTYRGLLNEKERLDLQRADGSMKAGIASARDDLVALARRGVTSGPEWDGLVAKVTTLTNERVANPRLAYPREHADYDMQLLQGDLKANGFLFHVDQVYKDQQLNVAERRDKALDYAKTILTDPSIKLTEAQRQHYYHAAVAEIHVNEGLRRQDVWEVRQAEHDLTSASLVGLPVDPEMVNRVGDAYHKLGEFSGEARLYAHFSRKPLNDAFGQQPLADQTTQLTQLRGAALPADYLGAIKKSEGFTPVAKFDFKQYTSGYGTRAGPGETIDRPEAERRFNVEIGKAAAIVDQVNPNLPAGARAALTSLTFNAGADWVNSELGNRVRAGDLEGAKARFLQYNQAGGEMQPALVARRRAEAEWFGGTLPPAGETTPAQSLWLGQNRAREIRSESDTVWKTAVKDWDEKGIKPNDAVVKQVIDAARASDNWPLLERVAVDLDRIGVTQSQARAPLAGQQAAITEVRGEAEAGNLTVGQAAVLKDLERRYQAITTGLEKDPVATTVANFPERFRAPAPLDLTNDQAMVGGLRYRAQIAGFAMQNWGGGAHAALDTADLAAVKGVLDKADPSTKARIFGDIAAGIPDERVRNATLAKIGSGGGDAMVGVYAGSLLPTAPDVARGIFTGQTAIKTDKRYDPMEGGPGEKQDFLGEIDKMLPVTTFGMAGRTDPTGPYETIRNAVRAQYGNLSAIAGDTSGKLVKDRLQKAVDDVTGGVLEHNGGHLIAPRRGMSQGQFDDVMRGLTDRDFAGVTTLAGEPVTADYVQRNARLETIGDGRYLVQLGKDPARPIYAYQGAATELPGKFVLDFSRRLPPPVAAPPAPAFGGG